MTAMTDLEMYRRHVEDDKTLREVAREAGIRHASTVLRRVRRIEARRDDPLIDAALDRPRSGGPSPGAALLILRQLAKPQAELLVAEDMDKAIVVRDGIRAAILPRVLAEHIVLAGWVHPLRRRGTLLRYALATAGRRQLRDLRDRVRRAEGGDVCPVRIGTPLEALARHKASDGTPWLDAVQVNAGDRLRGDHEAALLEGAGPAQTRVDAALAALGPDLADLALRVLCHLEGLETAERRFGWPARSGKLALRLALSRLVEHYQAADEAAP